MKWRKASIISSSEFVEIFILKTLRIRVEKNRGDKNLYEIIFI